MHVGLNLICLVPGETGGMEVFALGGALAVPVVPTASGYVAGGDERRLRELAVRGTRYTLALFVPVCVTLIVLAGPILEVWLGERYRDERLASARLVLPGAPTDYEEQLRTLARELGVEDRVHLPAWLEDADLEGLYRLARCVALPSRLEGFGLPVLEAMARGVPVACTNRTALPEVAGEAALQFDPDDDEAVTAALARLLADEPLRRNLAARGRERAALFTWEATAEATVASYRRTLSRP